MEALSLPGTRKLYRKGLFQSECFMKSLTPPYISHVAWVFSPVTFAIAMGNCCSECPSYGFYLVT